MPERISQMKSHKRTEFMVIDLFAERAEYERAVKTDHFAVDYKDCNGNYMRRLFPGGEFGREEAIQFASKTMGIMVAIGGKK